MIGFQVLVLVGALKYHTILFASAQSIVKYIAPPVLIFNEYADQLGRLGITNAVAAVL